MSTVRDDRPDILSGTQVSVNFRGLKALQQVDLQVPEGAIVGLTWFAVVITNGRRSNNAALAAGLFYTLIPQLFTTYLPTSWGPLPTLLFGMGAVLLARNPDGIITMNGRQIEALARRLTRRGQTGGGQPVLAAPLEGRVPASAVAVNREDAQ